MHPLLNVATRAALDASKIILQSLDRLDSINVTQKQRNDFVTGVDRTAEEIIIEQIKEKYPHHKILGEESGEHEGANDNDITWIIDPLDGTANFIHAIPHFCISIAVKEKNRLIVGLVYDPIRNELFTAAKGEGARVNDRRIRVSPSKSLEGSILATGFPFKKHSVLSDYLKSFEKLFTQAADIRRAGSAALDLAYVAAGRYDGFWEFDLAPWDIAAGALLIREAGGMVTDLHGSDDYLKTGSLVAGNPRMLKAILNTMRAEP
jgi:myo-inositol-1(or 4)-monophosphatase